MGIAKDLGCASIVIPAYEESSNLLELLPSINREIASTAINVYEIIVVLPDFATQNDVQLIEEFGARVVLREPTNSFGDALRCGFSAVSREADWVITMDADGSHAPETIPRLLAASPLVDVVVASRYAAGGSSDNALASRLMSRGLNAVYGIVLGIRCKDISTNFKRYRSKDLMELDLKCQNFDIVEEIFFRLKVLNGDSFNVLEIPDHFFDRKHGQTKRRLGPFIVSYIRTLLRLRWQLRR